MKNFLLFSLIVINLPIYGESTNDINSFIRSSHFKEKNLGITISSDGKNLYELNSNKLMIPASLTKIFTAGAVLKTMPMNTKFKTELWSNGKIISHSLNGNLCLKGGGDPSFVSEKMWFLVNELTRNELSKINGNIIVDSNYFDEELFDSGRESVRVDRAFDAPISAVSFNWNSVNVFIRPGDSINSPAKIFLDPINTYLEIENKIKTSKENSKKVIDVQRVKVGDHDKIIVSGNIPINSEEAVVYKSITNPNLWAGSHLIQFLKQRGIEFNGSLKVGKCDENSIKLASVDSKNLNEMLSDMLKFSNNFVAEMLAKNLAAFKNPNTPAKMKDGITEIKNFLEQSGIPSKDYELENVSGLTRSNKFTSNQIVKVLYVIQNDFQVYPEFLAGLPIAGIDGTLKKRLKNSEDSLVRAKTGYLDGVVGLAGYMGRKNKSPIVFAFMFNGEYEQGLEARKLFDGIIERVKKWD